jgi:NADH:ubiquinone oxidoreductase subunit E
MDDKIREMIAQFKKDRSSLLPILRKVQEEEKCLSPESIKEISDFLDLSENYIYSVASFYPLFHFNRPGDHTIKVCICNACHLTGGDDILKSIENELNIHPGERTDDGKFSLEKVIYAGCSPLAPVVVIDRELYPGMTPEKVKEILARYK